MNLRALMTLAWQADYGQFYLVDCKDEAFLAPVDITAEMEKHRIVALAAGLVIYTQDCLQQHLRISIYDAEPNHSSIEPMSGHPWTQVETVRATFPSRRFAVSSPSMPSPMPGGPQFLLETETVMARISWMEFQGSRDDSVPIDPDVIEITLWPASSSAG